MSLHIHPHAATGPRRHNALDGRAEKARHLYEALERIASNGCGCGVMTPRQCFTEASLRIWREEVTQIAAAALAKARGRA